MTAYIRSAWPRCKQLLKRVLPTAGLLAAPLLAGPSPDEAAIRQLISKFEGALNRRNALSISAEIGGRIGVRLIDNPEYQGPSEDADRIAGADQTQTLVQDRLNDKFKSWMHTCRVESVQFLNPEVAIAYIVYSGDGKDRHVTSSVVAAFLKTEGSWNWRLIAPMMPVLPTAAPPGILDGTKWAIAPRGTPYHDQIVFEKGVFIAGSSLRKGFYPTRYSASREGNKIYWSVKMPGDLDQAIVWKGELAGDPAEQEVMTGRWSRIGLPERNPLEPIVGWTATKE